VDGSGTLAVRRMAVTWKSYDVGHTSWSSSKIA
jgi:hypothetical protein